MSIRKIAQCLLALASIAMLQACAREPSSPAPPGWTVYSTSVPATDALLCAAYSRHEWTISLTGEAPQISAAPGERLNHTIQFEGGRFEGLDMGEFGGGLWWIDPQNKTKTQISRENVRGFIHTDFGTFVLTGLDHMSLRSGRVLRAVAAISGPPTMTEIVDLGEEPKAFTLSPASDVIVVTATKVWRIRSPAVAETLFTTNYELLYPNSVAVSKSGTIYVGMRQFVTRSTLVNQSYHEDWLTPADCPEFQQQGLDCVCRDHKH